MNIGDIVIAKQGRNSILGWGVITSDYYYDSSKYPEYPSLRNVKWVDTETKSHDEMGSIVLKTLTNITPYTNYVDKMKKLLGIDTDNNNAPVDMKQIKLLKQKKQIILQGAPGTGKTYKTAELAVALCDGVDTLSINREKIMERYRELYDEGRIGFVTFHQSTDYEEFVEGIKPSLSNRNISYKICDGIFKRIAKKSLCYFSEYDTITSATSVDNWFNELYDNLLEQIKEYGEISLADNKNTYPYFIESINGEDSIHVRIPSKKLHIKKMHLQALWNNGVTLENIDNKMRQYNKSPHTYEQTYYKPILYQMLKKNQPIKKTTNNILQKPLINNQPYLLIIDEINRGNISKIFGELITLLEADKRIGEENELTVTLPYSQETFGVPSNLYIIGTMNTADRSVGYIDYAIRRRFAFITLKADRNVIESYYTDNDLKQKALAYFDQADALMKVSSEYEKDDLMIGHSYFLAKSEEELQNKMIYEVRPLLLEYFNDGLLAFRKDDEEYKAIKNFGEA